LECVFNTDEAQAEISRIGKVFQNHFSMIQKRSRPVPLTTHAVSERLLLSELCNLDRALRALKFNDAFPEDAEPAVLGRILLSFCGAVHVTQVQDSASRCLGELHALVGDAVSGTTSEDLFGASCSVRGSFSSLLSGSVEALVDYVRSPDVKIALLAIETLKTITGLPLSESFRGSVHEPLHKSLLDSIVSAWPHEVILPTNTASAAAREISPDMCWRTEMWTSGFDGSVPFDEWICQLVVALISCNYSMDSSAGGESRDSALFFIHCQAVATVEPSFACSLFSAIVLDLLQREKRSGKNEIAEESGVAHDTWIGVGCSSSNERLSNCFSACLNLWINREKEERSEAKGVYLLTNTLDILRQSTQRRFLASSEHRRNHGPPASLSPTDISVESGMSPGGPCPLWKGLLFGTVLRIDGLLLARVLQSCGRPTESLFYSELYAETRFSGSTSVQATIFSERESSTSSVIYRPSDISGFGPDGGSCETGMLDSSSSDLRPDGVAFFRVRKECFDMLGEIDESEESTQVASDVAVDHFDAVGHGQSYQVSPLKRLQQLDISSSSTSRRGATDKEVLECLKDLGLWNTIRTVASGFGNDDLSDQENLEVRDRWYESCLFDMQGNADWTVDVVSGRSSANDSPRKLPAGRHRGFNELTVQAVDALNVGDVDRCTQKLSDARHELLSHPSLDFGHIGSLRGESALFDRLQTLNEVSRLLSKRESLDDLLRRWNLNAADSTSTFPRGIVGADSEIISMQSGRTQHARCVRELVLRPVALGVVRVQDLPPEAGWNSLVNEVWSQCRDNCLSGHIHCAGGSLRRLRHLIDHRRVDMTQQARDLEHFRLRLQEASVLESAGDFRSAIRTARLVLRCIEPVGSAKGDDVLKADALLACGQWMARYKSEPGSFILEKYLLPGSRLNVAIREREPSLINTRSATTSLLAAGELASTLLETVKARVAGVEWQSTESSIVSRRRELEACEEILRTAQLDFDKTKSAESKKKLSEIMLYRHSLNKELQNLVTERDSITDSLASYQKVSLESYVAALRIADDDATHVTKHVFRFVSLWMETDTTLKIGDALDAVIAEAVDGIPTFRFVPLSSQLFARLEKTADRQSSLPLRLRDLVRRMCTDHPHHCLLPLLALANGKEVGSGVSQRNADAFLENLNKSKVEAAIELLATLKKSDPSRLGPLLEGLETLAAAYIHLALADTSMINRNITNVLFSSFVKSRDLRLDRIVSSFKVRPCVITRPPALRPRSDYGSDHEDPIGSERIAGFDHAFSLTDGGIHRPKIVVCIGSQKGRYKQLVKGEDEIRQDAVMAQVFTFVNQMMELARTSRGELKDEVSRSASTARLRLVTYNIIPLSPASGVRIGVLFVVPGPLH
jgi:hypothetical protein